MVEKKGQVKRSKAENAELSKAEIERVRGGAGVHTNFSSTADHQRKELLYELRRFYSDRARKNRKGIIVFRKRYTILLWYGL